MKAPKKKNAYWEALKDYVKGLFCKVTDNRMNVLELNDRINNLIYKANKLADQTAVIIKSKKKAELSKSNAKTEEVRNKYQTLIDSLSKAYDKIEEKHKDMVSKIEILKDKAKLIEVQYEVSDVLQSEMYINDDSITSLLEEVDRISIDAEVEFDMVTK